MGCGERGGMEGAGRGHGGGGGIGIPSGPHLISSTLNRSCTRLVMKLSVLVRNYILNYKYIDIIITI